LVGRQRGSFPIVREVLVPQEIDNLRAAVSRVRSERDFDERVRQRLVVVGRVAMTFSAGGVSERR
jgi:hypothetical protein